jgi:hypothetical protein
MDNNGLEIIPEKHKFIKSKLFLLVFALIVLAILLFIFIRQSFLISKKKVPVTNTTCTSGSKADWLTGIESTPKYKKMTSDYQLVKDFLNKKCQKEGNNCTTPFQTKYIEEKGFVSLPFIYSVQNNQVIEGRISPADFPNFVFNVGNYVDLFNNDDLKVGYVFKDPESEKQIMIDKIVWQDSYNKAHLSFYDTNGQQYQLTQNGYLINLEKKPMQYDSEQDFIKYYVNERKKIVSTLGEPDRTENQIYDLLVKTNQITPNNKISDIYSTNRKSILGPSIDGPYYSEGKIIYGLLGGEIYQIFEYKLDTLETIEICKNTWRIGGGSETNRSCKIPQNVSTLSQYIEEIKSKCQQVN